MSPQEILQRIEQLASCPIPADNNQYHVLPSKRQPEPQDFLTDKVYRAAAVSINIFPSDDGKIRSVLIKRPEYDGKHSGQISFPGGKHEPDDLSLEYTARRECFEEIGIDVNDGRLLAAMGKVYIPVSGFSIQPFVFYHSQAPLLRPDSREVEDIISFDFSRLIDADVIKRGKVRFANGVLHKDVPYFDIDGRIVWGATAMMLAELQYFLKT